MRTVSCLLPPLPYSGPATQARLLTPALREIGINLQAEYFDQRFTRNLFRIHRPTADLVHIVGLPTLRRFFVSPRCWRHPPLIQTLNGHERLTRLDRWLLQQVERIVVTYPAARDDLATQGLAPHRITVIPPAVVAAPATLSRTELLRSHGLADDAMILMASGSMHRPHELTNAIWAYEVMRYTSDRFCLFVLGDGPERSRAEAFAASLAPEGTRVRFLGQRPDVSALLSLADAVLVTPSAGGLNIALEAMAAGSVVVAHRTPQLASLITHEINGLLITAGDHPSAAKALKRITTDRPFRDQLRTAALATAAQYTVARAINAWQSVYSLPQ